MTNSNSNRFPVDRKLLARIFSKIKVSTENFYKGVPCWEWQAFRAFGYGRLRYSGKIHRAHRVIYQMFVECLPSNLHCDHLCRNRKCVNPSHLEPVVQKENNFRSPISPTAINARKTFCDKGHPFSGENLGIYSKRGFNERYCKSCHKQATKQSRATREQKDKRNEYERKRLQNPIALEKRRESLRRYNQRQKDKKANGGII